MKRLLSRPHQNRADRAEPADAILALRWPWWLHPAWALLLVTGTTAAGAFMLPAGAFQEWGTRKYLGPDSALILALGIAVMMLGIAVVSPLRRASGAVQVCIDGRQLDFLKRSYRAFLLLTILGYAFWFAIAAQHGIGLSDLMAVVSREQSALRHLKENARPVAGLTTLTQFGPVAASLGLILRRLGHAGRGYLLVLGFATIRTLFYAERLALLEIAIPLVVLAALTTTRSGKARRLVQVAPLIGAPFIWLLFAASEYTRSWVYYQHTTELGFPLWVSERMLGYYATAFNNSALFVTAHHNLRADPYFSFEGLWNAPGASHLLGLPYIGAVQPEAWWENTLLQYSTPEFNNYGSFLMTYGELGVWMVVLWALLGIIIGATFVSLSRGRLFGLVAFPVLFIGLLELPRMLYWTEGRATPVWLALLVIGVLQPKRGARASRGDKSRRPQSVGR